LPRFGAFFVLKGTAFRCFILEPVPDVPLVRLWGSIGTRIPIWEKSKTHRRKIFIRSRATRDWDNQDETDQNRRENCRHLYKTSN
jgi:hypothetical protein